METKGGSGLESFKFSSNLTLLASPLQALITDRRLGTTAVSPLIHNFKKRHKCRSDKENLFSIYISSLSRCYAATWKRAEFHTDK
jgi:hypothetical protein